MKFRKLIEGVETDSLGNQLTPEQSAFFANSKIRDTNGKLLLLYHGTPNNFDVFDKEKIGYRFRDYKGNPQYTLGFYFTDDEDYATYVGMDGLPNTVKKCYLNITNPLIINKSGWGSAITVADILHSDIERWSKGHDGIVINHTEGDDFDRVVIAFEPNQIKSISNKNPTSSKNINEKSDNLSNEFESDLLNEDAVHYTSDSLSFSIFESKLISLFNTVGDDLPNYLGAPLTDSIDPDSALYLLPNGKILSTEEAGIASVGEDGHDAHRHIVSLLGWKLLNSLLPSKEDCSRWLMDNCEEYGTLTNEMYPELTTKYGWARLNCGNTWVEDRFYCVLPTKMSSSQYSTLLDWLEWGESNGRSDVLIFIGDGDLSKVYSFTEYYSEDILKKIKRFYSSGRFYESKIASNHGITEAISCETDSLGNELSEEQSRYFKNSKVRDRNGRLLVVHHGTYNSFDSFDAGDIGFHFGTEKAAMERKDYYDNETNQEWKVGKYYLNITNFLDMYDIADWDGSNLAAHIIESRLLDLSDEDIKYLQQIQMMGGLGMSRNHEPTTMLRKFLTDRGIDGIMYENAYEDSGSISYIAFNPEQIKFITNKTPTSSRKMNENFVSSGVLLEDALIPETNVYVDFVNELHSKFNSMSTEQIISFLNINQRNDLDTESPMFILPNGKFVSVQETLDTNGVDTVELTHLSICECFAWRLMSDLKYDTDTIEEIVDQDWRLERELGDFLAELTYKLGWARINCGTKAVDRRFYGVLPNEVTNKQWWSFETWLNWGYDQNKSDVLVFVTDEAIAKKFKMNDFAPIFPEDIIKTIRRFYSSGRFYESVSDKKLTERLQRLASNAFITDSPYQVRDLLMNKPKLYRILYDKNIDRYMIGDGNEVIHWELIEAAYKQGHYYMMDDFIDEIGTLDNYVEFGQGGQFLGDEEIESYLIYMVFSPDEEEFMLGEDGYQFRYKLPFGYIYTRDCYLEDCDLYNVVKRNITINEEKKMRNLIEGVWALPDNQRKVDIIKRLFKKEITADDIDKVKDTLYNVLGSDELFDSFDSEEDVDYRYNIAGYLRDFLDNYSDKIDKELVDQLEETISSFDRMYKKRVKESYIHTNSSGNPCDLVCGSALKVGDSVYDDKSGHKLDVIEVEEMNSWSKYITFNDTVTGKTEQRHVGNLALFELAGEGDEQVEVDDDIEIEWHPIDDYFDGNI